VEIAQKHAGTELGEKALINAFVTARGEGDPEKIFDVGEKLIRAYPSSDKLADVLATMGKVALDTLQFGRGATYLEAAARRKSDNEGTELLKAAGTIRARLGERNKAEQNLNTFLRLGGSAQDKAEMAVKVAKLHIQAADWTAAIALLQKASLSGASSAEMMYLLGYAMLPKEPAARRRELLRPGGVGGQGRRRRRPGGRRRGAVLHRRDRVQDLRVDPAEQRPQPASARRCSRRSPT